MEDGKGNDGHSRWLGPALVAAANAAALALMKHAGLWAMAAVPPALAVANLAFCGRNSGRPAAALTLASTFAAAGAFFYVLVNAFYFEYGTAAPWLTLSAIAIAAAWRSDDRYVMFPALLGFQNGLVILALEIANANPANPAFSQTPAGSYSVAAHLWLVPAALAARLAGRAGISNSAMLAALACAASYLFSTRMEPSAAGGALTALLLISVFAVFAVRPSGQATADAVADTVADDVYRSESLRAQFAVLAVIAIAAVFAVTGASATRAVVELDCGGAALYYDDLLGYVARFRSPTDSFFIDGDDSRRNLFAASRRVWIGRSSAGGFSVSDVPRGESTLPPVAALVSDVFQTAGRNAVAVDIPGAFAVVAGDKTAGISNRFAYRVKIGVSPSGATRLLSWEPAGDRFMLFDDENHYNRYRSHVRSFAAVSPSGRSAAVYDFSGSIRFFDAASAKAELILGDVRNMRAIAAAGDDGFFVLTATALLFVDPKSKSVREVATAASLGESAELVDVTAGDGLVLVSGSGGSYALGRDGRFMRRVPGGAGGMSCPYFGGDHALWCDYFSRKAFLREYFFGTAEASVSRETAVEEFDSAVVRASGARLAGMPSVLACSWSEKASAFGLAHLGSSAPSARRPRMIALPQGTAVHDFDVSSSGGGTPLVAWIGDSGEVTLSAAGFFFQRELSARPFGDAGSAVGQRTPSWCRFSGDSLWVFHANSFARLLAADLSVRAVHRGVR